MEGKDPPVMTGESEEDTFWDGEPQESRIEQPSGTLTGNSMQVCPDSCMQMTLDHGLCVVWQLYAAKPGSACQAHCTDVEVLGHLVMCCCLPMPPASLKYLDCIQMFA